MKCPQCQQEGKKSIITIGFSTTTLMSTHAYYDEDGKYHFHNPNITTTEYSCSNGHEWTEKR